MLHIILEYVPFVVVTVYFFFFRLFCRLYYIFTRNNYEELMIIGITGRKQSGKDTVGNYLVKNHGFVRVAFADVLKEACRIIFHLDDEQLYGNAKEIIDSNWQHTPREILQKVGTELFRDELPKHLKISNDIWIRSVNIQIRNLSKQGYTRFVVTDVRFKNEFDFVMNLRGGVTWKVIRQSIMHTQSEDLHASEAQIDTFRCNCEFYNDRTKRELYNMINNEINHLKVQN